MAASENHLLKVGDVVGSYEIEGMLATGETTTTYRARHRHLKRVVALKVLHPSMFLEPGERERAQQQAVEAASLEHPGIVPVLDAGPIGDGLWVATALVDGPTLTEVVSRGEVDPARCADIVSRLAEALAVAHDSGVVHREVRPGCVVIGRRGNPLLRDFGVTRLSGRTGLATRLEFLETVRYAAPEQILGRRATPASDVYGLTATAMFCLAGEQPFPDLPIADMLRVRADAPPPRFKGADAERLNDVLGDGMAVDAAARPSGGNLAGRLADAVRALPAELREMPSPFVLTGRTAARAAPAQAPAEAAPVGATRVDRRRDVETVDRAAAPPGRPWATIATCAGIVTVVGVAAFGVGKVTAPDAPAVPRTAGFAVPLGHVWTRDDAVSDGNLREPIALRAASAPGTAVVGVAPAGTPPGDPLPDEVRASYERPPKPDLVRVGSRTLVRYRGALRGGGHLTTYVLPTTASPLVVLCRAPSVEDACAALAAAARLGPAAALPPRPPRAAASVLATALQRVEVERGNSVPGLAGKRSERADAATRLAAAYREVAPSLDIKDVDAGTRAQLAALRKVMQSAAGAYEDLASAVDQERAVAYASARRAALVAERRLRSGIARLQASGYGVAR